MAEKITGAKYLTQEGLTDLMCKAIKRAEQYFNSHGLYVEFELCYVTADLAGAITTQILIDGVEVSRKNWDIKSAYLFYKASWDDVVHAVAKSLILEVFEQLDNNTLYIDEFNNNWIRQTQNRGTTNG